MAVTSRFRFGWNLPTVLAGAPTFASADDCGPADEPDHGFERDFHLEARSARLLAARFDLRILRDRGGNRVGQLSCEPVHDVVHLWFLLAPPELGPGAPPDRNLPTPWR